MTAVGGPDSLGERLRWRAQQVEAALDQWLPPATQTPALLHESLRYSVFAGGKRLRPALLLETNAALGGADEYALPAAAAVEMIHTYSLVHDDLPCMDDDALRRGKPTNHVVYGEPLALLCGDALLTEAFAVLSQLPAVGVPPAAATEVARLIALAAGSRGMVGGQAVDIASESQDISAETLDFIHRHKTAALITAAVEAGAVIGGATAEQRQQLASYGREIGLAFQIVDDLLDVEGATETLGKESHADEARGKATYPRLHGLEDSRRAAAACVTRAQTSLSCLGERGASLAQLATRIVERQA